MLAENLERRRDAFCRICSPAGACVSTEGGAAVGIVLESSERVRSTHAPVGLSR